MVNQHRHLAAILFTDIVGYTAMMQENESQAVTVINHYLKILEKTVPFHQGQILNNYGDGSLCSFPSAREALNCAIDLQREFQTEPCVPLRIGLHIGEIFFEKGKVLGDSVNLTSRIQSLGIANSILLSTEFCSSIKNQPEFKTVTLGHFHFKNVNYPIEVFALTNEGLNVPGKKNMEGKLESKTNNERKWMITVSTLVTLAIISYFLFRNQVITRQAELPEKTIAVLPFVDMSPGKDQEYFSDGLSDELLNLLSKIPELKVIGRTSSFSFKGKNEDIRIIGKKLGVAHILEGSVQKNGNKIRVTAQLIKTDDGSHLWSEKYDRNLSGIFELQDEIAGAVVNQLKLQLLPAKTNVISPPPTTEVYNLILLGNYFAERRDKESLAKALDYYLKAVAIDSLNARCWAGVAKCYTLQSTWGWIDRKQGYEKARKASTKAIEQDSNLAEGHRVLGMVKMNDYNWNGAEMEYQKALKLEPANAEVLRIIGYLYRCTGRFDEGIRYMNQSIKLDPLKPITYFNLGFLQYAANYTEEAIVSFKKALELNPLFPRTHTFLAEVYVVQGKPGMALAEAQQETDKGFKDFGLAIAYQALGNAEMADRILKEITSQDQGNFKYRAAIIHALRGEKDKAFELLEKAWTEKDPWFIFFKGDPLLKNLEDDPRHKAFLTKMNLPSA